MDLLFLWFSLAVVFFTLEFFGNLIFLFLPFCLGALLAALTSFWITSLTYQVSGFLGSSIIFLALLRIFLNPMRLQKPRFTAQLTGKRAIVSKTIAPAFTGQVTVDGKTFDAQSVHGEIILTGAPVTIVGVKNTCVLVQ